MGGAGDSTYFINTDRLGPNAVVYSGGLGHQIEFELELIRGLGLRVFGFDPTDESARYMRQKTPPGLTYSQIGLAGHDGEISFRTSKAPSTFYRSLEVVSDAAQVKELEAAEAEVTSFPVRRIKTLMQHFGHDHIDLLKIDIEGSEYAVLDDMAAEGIWPDQIALEWHPRIAGQGDPDKGWEITHAHIARLEQAGYVITNAQRRNTEMTFERPQTG